MALDITTQDIVIDETTGLQNDDISPSSNPTLLHLLTLGTALEVASKTDFVQATADAGETITSVVLTQDSSGTPFSTTDGVVTDIQTVDGNYVWLFQDPNNADVVIGVIGTDDPTAEPDPTDPLAFSFGLDHTSATDADLYLVQYVALLHPNSGDPDDQIDLTDLVYASIEGTSQINFSGQNAAPGNHDFYLINSPDDAAKQLLVIDANGGTANVSTQGFGVDNNSINPGETLQVDFVTGGLLNAGTASQIQYGSHIETITEAGFTINQITPSTPTARVDVTISAFDNTLDQQGTDFFDGTTTSAVDITSVTLTGQSGVATTITADGDYVTGGGDTIHVSGLTGTGNAVTITGLDNITTVDITTATNMDRMTVTGVDANEGCDITEFHFSATTTNAHTEEVGSFINFDDDGPTVAADGTVPTLTTDDTNIPDTTSTDFSGVFTTDPGADGLDGVTYALGVKSAGVDSGLDDTLSGDNILLRVNLSGQVEGYLENDTGTVAFLISVDSTGEVTLTQNRAIVHNDPGDPVESGASAATLAAADLVTLTATATDGDGDTDDATANIGTAFTFEDDGPTVTADGTVPTLVTDDSELSDTASAGFASAFTTDLGADGGAVTYALDVQSAGVDSGLDDTLSGDNILLRVNLSGQVEGYLESDTATVAFLISVDENTGEVTLTQDRAVIHNDPTDPVESGASAAVLAAAGLVTLTATATDGDGDTASDTADIGTAFTFEDDGPTITVPFDGDASGGGSDGTHESLVNAAGEEASGAFGYDIGADAHTALFYTNGGSDFVDQDGDPLNGVQIALSGTIIGGGGGTLITSDVTLASEDSASATFNFSFTYDKDPAPGVQTGTAAGTLVFDKVLDTYAITLTDALEGFSFDVLHTNELLAKAPTGNTGHPLIVAEQLTPNGDPDPFFVQFTANSTTNSIKFGFNSTGDGAVVGDTTFNNGGATHDMITNLHEDWVSATQATNGVAGDTIQKGEALTLRFFEENILGDVNPKAPGGGDERLDPTAVASGVVIKFDGIGNSEDLVLILDLKDANGNEITRAVNVQNSDLIKGNANVPFPYSTEFTLDNNDALLILEQNDYTAAGETYQIQGIQIMQSANGLTGTAINLDGAIGANHGSSTTSGLTAWDPTDNDVLKIVDIGFVQQTSGTVDANLDFAFQVADADGDSTDVQHILVDVA
ncbi:hypothetical protein FJV76_11770 [Mesorhizobium sp. WSM4303]|uniref:DUF5801 repeats-in-toxin domain-containing protein n=1 Tax=unclassified Mesorhizobium TaxID=325217 RepID=UPI00115EC9A0|nr:MULTISPECIES: DUF5801 repeats-in-toxin domain-containing protein [unclassified Mesorhizobium]TRC93283.1 hypothetical protein FJV77_22500 [Mesorhizobium sp. WSM4306]TRD04951.1 hypothetical protein FJV76_11770 [Mesorhizobium sp. WSM4303]